LSDKLPANLGYLYENLVAQMITDSAQTSRKSAVSNEPSAKFSSFPKDLSIFYPKNHIFYSKFRLKSPKISSLPTRPTAPTAFGGKGYSATEMKEAFDRLPLYVAERLNSLIDDIESGSLADLIAESEPFATLLGDVAAIKARLGL
jgi:hypothetical protein